MFDTLTRTDKIKSRIDIFADPLYVVNEEEQENATDLKSGSTIISRPQMLLGITGKESMM